MTSKYSKFKWNNGSQASVISIGKTLIDSIALNQSACEKSLSHWKIHNGVSMSSQVPR